MASAPPEFWSMRVLEQTFRTLERISGGERVRQFFIARAPEGDVDIGYRRAASALDVYIVGWVAIEVGLLAFAKPVPNWLIVAVVVYRIVEIVQVYGNGLLFDATAVWSAARSLVQMIVLLFEVSLLYGLLYWVARADIHDVRSIGDALYLSFGTMTTGPTEASPHGWTRFLTTSEVFFGFLFGVAILGRFVGLLPAVRDASVAPEIPRRTRRPIRRRRHRWR